MICGACCRDTYAAWVESNPRKNLSVFRPEAARLERLIRPSRFPLPPFDYAIWRFLTTSVEMLAYGAHNAMWTPEASSGP